MLNLLFVIFSIMYVIYRYFLNKINCFKRVSLLLVEKYKTNKFLLRSKLVFNDINMFYLIYIVYIFILIFGIL